MSDIKKKLLEEIDQRVARKQEMKDRALERNTIDSWVIQFIKNVEDMNAVSADPSEVFPFYISAFATLLMQLRTIDNKCEANILWMDSSSHTMSEVNGVLIKWSKAYQEKTGIEPELFVDITSLLFR